MENLFGKTLDELHAVATSLGMPRFTAKQIAHWLYKKRVGSVQEMTNLSLACRQRLIEAGFTIEKAAPVESVRAKDGTVRYLFATTTGKPIETVFLPERDRATLCLSSQIGCKMHCAFCMTGRQGFNGQLTAAEVLNQVFSIPESERLTNLVFMGMGEPLDNYPTLLHVWEILTAEWGLAWSPRRLTVSTVGLRATLAKFIEQTECHLAISLHNPIPAERAAWMPAESAYPITDIVADLRPYDWAHQRELTFEYIVMKGQNDDHRHADALLKLLRGLPCKVNLIKFHAIPDAPFESTDVAAMERFRDYLCHHGLFATIRASRGEDIYAACGMLSSTQRGHQTLA